MGRLNPWQRLRYACTGTAGLIVLVFLFDVIRHHGFISWYVTSAPTFNLPDIGIDPSWIFREYGTSTVIWVCLMVVATYGFFIDSALVIIKNGVRTRDEYFNKAYWHALGWFTIWNICYVGLVT